jgi:C4-dicarboxylate transporter, DctQ subunit
MKEACISASLRVGRVMTIASVAIVMFLALPITYNALVRELRHPTIWVFEIMEYALIAAGFLGNPLAMKSGAHFRVTLLLEWFPSLRPALNVFSLFMTLVFALFLIGTGSYFVWYSWTNNILSGTILNVPLWIPQLGIPLGGLGLFLQTLVLLITGREPGEGETTQVWE